jgi:CRISP-associated protein Cas1
MGTIYITEQGATLAKTDGRLLIRKDDRILQDIPAIQVDQIVVFGNAHFTMPAVKFILDNNIDVAYLSSRGRYRARLQPEPSKDGALRQAQYKKSLDPAFCLALSKEIVRGKIHNALIFLQRQRGQNDNTSAALDTLQMTFQRTAVAESLEAVRGFEGAASAAYYRGLRGLLRGEWNFQARLQHPPPDPINALLSLGYTLLYNHVFAALNVVGLDSYVGFFHQTRHGHATLASDLMEEWRVIIVDSVVLSVVNRGEISPKDFRASEGQVRLTREGLDRFLHRYDARTQSEVLHPHLRQRLAYLRCIELQVRHLANVLIDAHHSYHAFRTR